MKTIVGSSVILLGVPLMTVLAINYYHAVTATASAPCIANLRQMQGAKDQWVTENHKTKDDIPSDADLFGPDLYVRTKPRCPEGGVYSLGRVGEGPTCSLGTRNHRL